jgi:hypothetical protein
MEEAGEHKRVFKDLLCGCLSGAIAIYLTQPLDTIRVKLSLLIFADQDAIR